MNWKFWKKEDKGQRWEDFLPPVTSCSPMPAVKLPDIREPVLSIIEATKDISRWAVREEKDGESLEIVSIMFYDRTSSVGFRVFRSRTIFGSGREYIEGGEWMTRDEEVATIKALWKLWSDVQAFNLEEQRAKMTAIYCKGGDE